MMTAMSTLPHADPVTPRREPRSRTVHFREVLGKGGFGAVYLADVIGTDDFVQRVAVKVLSAEMTDVADFAARQRDEARLLGRLVHENVVRVMDLTEIDGRPAVIMEYVEGADLAQLLSQGALPPRACFQLIGAVASALQAVRATPDPQTGLPLDVVHRDIKPANVLVSGHGGVKVLDFGIARADFAREGKTGSVQFGTARYMAPEQWLTRSASHKVDIFALGITLAEALAGRPVERAPLEPVRFGDHVAGVVAHLTAADWPAGLAADVGRLLHGMLAFAPADRPDASAVADECLRLSDLAPGASLARCARQRVPALVERRRRRFAGSALPRPTTVDHGSGGPPPTSDRGSAGPTRPDTRLSLPVPEPSGPTAGAPLDPDPQAPTLVRPAPPPRRGLRPRHAGAALLAVLSLGLGLWWAAAPSPPAPLPTAAPAHRPAPGLLATEAPAPVAAAAPAPPEQAPAAPAPPADPPAPAPRSAAPPLAPPRPAPAPPAPPPEAAPPEAAPSEAPPPEAAPPAPAADPAPAAATPAPAPGPALPVPLTSPPAGARVRGDGRELAGTTPRRSVALAAGRHQLVVEGPTGRCAGPIRVSAARANTFLCDLATSKISARQ